MKVLYQENILFASPKIEFFSYMKFPGLCRNNLWSCLYLLISNIYVYFLWFLSNSIPTKKVYLVFCCLTDSIFHLSINDLTFYEWEFILNNLTNPSFVRCDPYKIIRSYWILRCILTKNSITRYNFIWVLWNNLSLKTIFVVTDVWYIELQTNLDKLAWLANYAGITLKFICHVD